MYVYKQKESLIERGIEIVAYSLLNLEELEYIKHQEAEAVFDV